MVNTNAFGINFIYVHLQPIFKTIVESKVDVKLLKKVLVLAVVFLLFSCKKEEPIPGHLLTPEEMIAIMIDIRTTEGQVAALSLSNDSSAKLYNVLEERLFLKHGVDTALYKESLQYYILRPVGGLYITDAVIDSLKVRQQRTQSNKK